MVLEIFVRSYIFYSFESGTVYHFTIFIFITKKRLGCESLSVFFRIRKLF